VIIPIRHKNIIAYKEAFFDESSGTLCIVMEYADDGDLYNKIMHYKKL
jgi:NIMA (never in mitosis gene a)-related kinase